MIVYIIREKEGGRIEEVHRTLDGAGRTLYGHGDAVFADGAPFSMASIEQKMQRASTIEVNYGSGDVLLLERHFVAG